MSDLISRQALLTELNEQGTPYSIDIPLRDTDTPKDIVNKTLKAYRKALIQMVNELPIAYDVEKVIAELKSEADRWRESAREYNDQKEFGYAQGIDGSINIVKRGGKDE